MTVAARFPLLWMATAAVCLASAGAAVLRSQGDDAILNAMVRIVATRNGETVRGSGFIVALDRDRAIATVLTSAHVVEGAKFEAILRADPAQSLAAEMISLETENRNGLAAFRVRNVPANATVLEIAAFGAPAPRAAQSLTLVGYPNTSTTPLARARAFSGREGALYLIDLGVGEGSSGGPVLLDGKVVGLVSSTTQEQTYAVPFPTLRTFLEGSEVQLGVTAAAPKPEPAAPKPEPAAPPPVVTPPAPSGGTPTGAEPGKDSMTEPPGAGGPLQAMARVTGQVNGKAVQASGFVVAIRRDFRDTYVATYGQLTDATDVQVTFGADRDHPLPGRYIGRAGHGTETDASIVLIRVEGEVAQAITHLEISGTEPPAERPLQLISSIDAGQPGTVERRYLGPDVTASFLFTLEGGIGPEFLGGPVLSGGKVAGLLVRSTGSRAVAISAAYFRPWLAKQKLVDQRVESK